MKLKLIVLGLDGATFELINPWIREGDLPNLKRIKEKGVCGTLESCLPPVTVPNWKCYSTGKNPGKLGVFWWEKINPEKKSVSVANLSSLTNFNEIWDYLNENGIMTGIINMPTTYPPKKIDGFLISGGPGSESRKYTHPSHLEEKLEDQRYKLNITLPLSSKNCKESIDGFIRIIKSRFEIARKLIKKYPIGFLHLTIFYINTLHHFLWEDRAVKKAWKVIDTYIGKLLKKSQNILIMSDHGSNEIHSTFHINSWLEEKGYLATHTHVSDLFSSLNINKRKLVRIIRKLRVDGLLQSFIPSSLRTLLPSKGGGVQRQAKGKKIDWEKTKAIASGQGPIYLTSNPNSKEYEDIRKKLKIQLEKVEDPVRNEFVVRKAWKKENIYSGRYLEQAPDLVLEANQGYHIHGDIGGEKIFNQPHKWKGENKKEGIFLAFGSSFKNIKVNKVQILDLAPTILRMFGIKTPKEMDGRVLQEILN